MNIKNSRLELEKLDSLDSIPEVMKRKDLRYKIIYAVLPKSKHMLDYTLCVSKSFKGVYKLETAEKNILEQWKEYYVITTSGERLSKVNYTDEEKKILISILSGLLREFKLDTAELLCHAIGNKELLDAFYSSYGSMSDIGELCKKLYLQSTISSIPDTSKLFPHQYQRSRYSIYDLAKDLVKDKAMICTSPDLTGKYKKISRSVKKTSEVVEDSWNQILGRTFNMTRANLNLNYLGNVTVEIPDNEFGVKPGPMELKTIKSICLVIDGKACNTSFGIKINSKKLGKKLKASGIIKEDLVCPGEYLINIANLPVLSKSKLPNIRLFDLGMAETWYKLSDIAIEYLKRREYKEKNKLSELPEKLEITEESDPKTKFLIELGIYNGMFYPTKKVDKISKVYNTVELVSKINGIPTKETCIRNITRILNGYGKSNKLVQDFLDSYVISKIGPNPDYENSIKYWESLREDCKNKIRDLKFKLILGKSLKVDVSGCRRKTGIITAESQIIRLHKIPHNPEIKVKWILKEKHVIV